jgi:hypothetical protein
MIGVAAKEDEKRIVSEFFELFKTPWEFLKSDRRYSVIISTQESASGLDGELILIYNSENIQFDIEKRTNVTAAPQRGALLKIKGMQIPIYGKTCTFDTVEKSTKNLATIAGRVAGLKVSMANGNVIRIGFDLFQEIKHLLTYGQPVEFSQIPTLDLHISILREWIVESGIPLVEIPPVPSGYRFACCLTHDIDFAGIRRHKFDYTILGFLYRALLGSMRNVITGKGSWTKLCRNWKAAIILPAVYMGIVKDFWMPFDRYREIEKDFHSTFFIIPFKNDPGLEHNDKTCTRRATRYDCSDIREEIKSLLLQGCEIGVHGIDAWRDAVKGRREFERIHEITGVFVSGIRMHWLYFKNQSPQILEEAGFRYDSTLGYNDAVGYRAGTVQVYRPIGAKKLLELPMNIQDTALFYPDRMGLNEVEAWGLIETLLDQSGNLGGALTIIWHDRSLAPERLWCDIYIKLIDHLRKLNAWVDTASRVVRWFDKRRSVVFEDVCFSKNKVNLRITGNPDEDVPDLMVRIHKPKPGVSTGTGLGSVEKACHDIRFANVLNAEYPI